VVITSCLNVTFLFNVFYNNNILLLQLKCPLNGQQEMKLNLFIATTQLRRLSLTAVTQLNTRGVVVEFVVEEVVLRKVSSGSFCLSLSGLFHHWSTSIYSFIYHCQYVIAASYSVVNKNTTHLSYIHNCKTGCRYHAFC